jgi:hypothetical protein
MHKPLPIRSVPSCQSDADMLHQVTQANISPEKRVVGVDQARQAAINNGRRLKTANGSAATPIRS